jgi:hypothetical protein
MAGTTDPDAAEEAGRPAWYVAAPGHWHDWVNVLHPPYTLWHLSYVAVGAGLAPRIDSERLAGCLIAFALAVGVAAHALDELRGRPLGTTIPGTSLVVAAALSLGTSTAIGAIGITRIGWPLTLFVAVGVILVVGYNFELFGGRLHNDVSFAAAWGAFPVATGYFAQTGTIRPAAVAGMVFAFGLSWTQRILSTESRTLRRDTRTVTGERISRNGTRHAMDQPSLLKPLDRSLKTLSWTTAALGLALVLVHV